MGLLYNEDFIAWLFTALVVATPVVALIGLLIRRCLVAGGCSRRGRVLWAVLALAGPANYGLWRLYNRIEDHWGLDSVKALLVNFALFVFLGIAVGLGLRFLLRAGSTPAETASTDAEDDKRLP